ncbi:MAG: type I DNA topoisomerase, partial [Acidimicrobiales bacterium]|nr:type I DNA topoisomerase [Acidimicrobiales bacterium]
MNKPLVIVESPTKAKTIARFLGDDYVVESSVGHIRDLPRNAADVPASYKGEKWARLGVDTDNDFKPLYVVTGRAKEQVRHLKALLKDATELYLATDEDREGEAIAWHLLEVLNPRVPVKRMVFHEITERAIQQAIDEPREIDRRLVDAQEARRILDRLYGYEVSPVLWKKVMPRLSAGRVQSVAVRLIVERERERMAFVSAGYWSLSATFADGSISFGASLAALDGSRIATGKDFDDAGALKTEAHVLTEADANTLAQGLAGSQLAVTSRESKPYRRRPAAPFITSTLQQEAGRKLGFSSSRTMQAAQRLYENGYITYMRTDSTTLSGEAVGAARSLISERYGQQNLPPEPRIYTRKVKNAQEAHEAIRPAGERWRHPDEISTEVAGDAARVYDLIWRRTVASQMIDATGETVTIKLGGVAPDGRSVEFSTSGTVITSPGFRLAYVEEAEPGNDDAAEQQLPPLQEDDTVTARELEPKGHETTPPARFTEASLVKRLEDLGVGRPSTYASIIETIQAREYVWKKGNALVPSFTAFATSALLESHFNDLVDYAFTARMEDDLDDIAGGDKEAIPWLSEFYFGTSGPQRETGDGLKSMVAARLAEIDAREINSIPIGVDEDGALVVARVGRYGPYVQRGDDTCSIPDDLAPDELTIDKAMELLSAPSDTRVLGTDPQTGIDVIAKPGRFGPYVTLGEPEDGKPKPKTASLFASMSLDTVTLDDALKLLSLPRVVGTDPTDGEEITAQNGRYGPYLKKGSDSRSLESEDQIFNIDLDGALAIYAQPKRRRGAAAPKPPLKELGEDPVSGVKIVVKDGRFGPYVTDGETNASLRKGDDVETITTERAAELLQIRREAGPSKKKSTKKKATAKKAGSKKAAAKKSA